MNYTKAKRVEFLRVTGPKIHTWEAISRLIAEEYPGQDYKNKGQRWHGIDLCQDAMVFLSGAKDIDSVPYKVREEWNT